MSLVFSGVFPEQFAAQNITGKWHGLFEFPGASLRLDLVVEQQNGKYKAPAYSPDQGNNPIPVDEFNYMEGKMEFYIHSLDVKYSGALDKPLATIKGIFE